MQRALPDTVKGGGGWGGGRSQPTPLVQCNSGRDWPRELTMRRGGSGPAQHWDGGGGGAGGGPIEQLYSDAMQQRTTSDWKGEVGWVGGTDRIICFRNYVKGNSHQAEPLGFAAPEPLVGTPMILSANPWHPSDSHLPPLTNH